GNWMRIMSMPFTTMSGAWSPPIASRAMTMLSGMLMSGSGRPGQQSRSEDLARFQNFAVPIMSAGAADMMRPFHFAAVRAFLNLRTNQCVMGTAHVALGFGGFSFWYCHFPSLSLQCPAAAGRYQTQ